uniref:Uncharacterized protein n=1 Tax=Moniliophthora roreri TaxID=221103 RepID=A0A0W0F2N8_MONRR
MIPFLLTDTYVEDKLIRNIALLDISFCTLEESPSDTYLPGQDPTHANSPNLPPSPLGSHYHTGKGTWVLNQAPMNNSFDVMMYPGHKKHRILEERVGRLQRRLEVVNQVAGLEWIPLQPMAATIALI